MRCQKSESGENDKCDKLTGIYRKDLVNCGRCREVLKIDLVRIITEMEKIYLTETLRNKSGRKSKLTTTEKRDIKHARRRGERVTDLAKKYKVSRVTIYNA